VLLAFGLGPVTANVSNTIGLVPGSAAGALGYRAELSGQGSRASTLAAASICGAVIGAVLLLSLPGSAFKAIVPAFIGLSLVLVVAQPRLAGYLVARRAGSGRGEGGFLAAVGVLLSGVYGGYFGAAQGILLLAILGIAYSDPLGRINALKVVLAGLVNLTSGIIFAVVAHVDWAAAGLIAAGSLLGGWLGARWGRRLSPDLLRTLIVIVGIAAIVRLA
jgi:uncharacterized membrane protein YfcA